MFILASTSGAQHQRGRRNPEEEDKDLGGDTGDGDGGGAAGERVGAVVGESKVDTLVISKAGQILRPERAGARKV